MAKKSKKPSTSQAKEQWYSTRMVFVFRHTRQETGPWEMGDRIFLLRAFSNEGAYNKAIQIAKKVQESETARLMEKDFTDAVFEFVGLSSLDELREQTIRDGSEVQRYDFEGDELPSTYVVDKENLGVFVEDRLRKHIEQLLPTLTPEQRLRLYGIDLHNIDEI